MSFDLKTQYGSLLLKTPFVVGACPLTLQEQTRLAIESAGAGALVLPSVFEEQVIRWSENKGHPLTRAQGAVLERANRRRIDRFCEDADAYLAAVNRASSQLSIPVIASMNGSSISGWMDFAGELQEAGADAIELNLHAPPHKDFSDSREIEDAIVSAVKEIGRAITIPLFLKLEQEFTCLSHMARRLLSGARGLVLFGRAPETDICLDNMELTFNWELTKPGSITQILGPIMRVHADCPAMPLAASGGIGTPDDAIKALLAGADVAMVTSAIYREGPDVIRTLIDGLVVFMERNRIRSLRELQLKRPLEFDSEHERIEYMKALRGRMEESHAHVSQRVMQGDRWGHRTVKQV